MAKYDFVIDTSDRSSTGLILSRIAPGSTVLEFGCANGRMTRYMKEELSCQVYIVEYDEPAFNDAVQYARDGICDDIMSFNWAEKFAGITFDAVIFADVLEHLTSPEIVVAKAAELLAESGSVHISVPNITHNDVLLKAYDERFDYTATGLLDDTHIHFWGMKNLSELAQRSGLTLRSVVGTYCDTGATEQYAQAGRDKNVLLENLLKQRACGEVYQFVVSMDKNPASGAVPAFRKSSVISNIYIDSGNDFGGECIPVEAVLAADGSYHAYYEIEDTAGIKRVRFDPIENQGCILRNVRICQDCEEIEFITTAEAEVEQGYLFLNDDPMVYVQQLPGKGSVTVEADILLVGKEYIDFLNNAYLDRINDKNSALAERDAVMQECTVLRVQNSEFARQETELQKRIASLAEELQNCRNEFGAYIFLANEKDEYAIRLEREISRIKVDLNYYENLWFVKYRRYAGRIVRGGLCRVKRILRKLVGKGEQ